MPPPQINHGASSAGTDADARRIRETVETLAGSRGGDRAVRLSEFTALLELVNKGLNALDRLGGREIIDNPTAPDPGLGGILGDRPALNVIPPGVPTGLVVTTMLLTDGVARLEAAWDDAPEPDFAYYTVQIGFDGGNLIPWVVAGPQFGINCQPGQTYEIKVRAVDAAGNPSGYTASATGTVVTDDEPPAVPTGLAIAEGFTFLWLVWNKNTEPDFHHYEIYESDTATPAPTAGTSATYATQSSQLVRADLPDTTTKSFWIRAVDTGGNRSAWAARSDGTTVTEVITATTQIRNAIITDAKILELSAAKLIAGTALVGSLTVNGDTIETVRGRASDPAARVNVGTTQIDPGKILISGATTLADWRMGGDATRIDGGAVSANTLAANTAVIGMRGVSIAGLQFEHNSPGLNQVAWTGGTIQYINDAGTATTATITGSNATWSSGTLYLYWEKGTTTIGATTSLASAMLGTRIILATYQGGTNLVTEYGRTVIDGSHIKTGSVIAGVEIKSSNYAESGGVPTAGFFLDAATGMIKAVGVITTDALANNSVTRQGVAGSGVVAAAVADGGWEDVASITLDMPRAGAVQGVVMFSLTHTPSSFSSTFAVRVLVNGTSRMNALWGGLILDNLVTSVRLFADPVTVVGNNVITLQFVRSDVGKGVQFSQLQAFISMK